MHIRQLHAEIVAYCNMCEKHCPRDEIIAHYNNSLGSNGYGIGLHSGFTNNQIKERIRAWKELLEK